MPNINKLDSTPLDFADIRLLRQAHDIVMYLSAQELLARIHERFCEGTAQDPQTEINNARVLILMNRHMICHFSLSS